jgi:hypothetical protein
MANKDRLELRSAFQVHESRLEQRYCNSIDRRDSWKFPSEDEWKLSDIVYTIGVEVGYAKGFVHATALLFTAMLAAAVWTSL